MAEDGAALIDVGGESTRPGAQPVLLEDELRRVLPVIERLRAATKNDVEKIGLAAKTEIEAAERAARVKLKALAAKLAVDGAESPVAKQMTPAVQESLINGFVQSLQGRPN